MLVVRLPSQAVEDTFLPPCLAQNRTILRCGANMYAFGIGCAPLYRQDGLFEGYDLGCIYTEVIQE